MSNAELIARGFQVYQPPGKMTPSTLKLSSVSREEGGGATMLVFRVTDPEGRIQTLSLSTELLRCWLPKEAAG